MIDVPPPPSLPPRLSPHLLPVPSTSDLSCSFHNTCFCPFQLIPSLDRHKQAECDHLKEQLMALKMEVSLLQRRTSLANSLFSTTGDMSSTSSIVPSNIATVGSPETKRSDPLGGKGCSTAGQGTCVGQGTNVEGQGTGDTEPESLKGDKVDKS